MVVVQTCSHLNRICKYIIGFSCCENETYKEAQTILKCEKPACKGRRQKERIRRKK